MELLDDHQVMLMNAGQLRNNKVCSMQGDPAGPGGPVGESSPRLSRETIFGRARGASGKRHGYVRTSRNKLLNGYRSLDIWRFKKEQDARGR